MNCMKLPQEVEVASDQGDHDGGSLGPVGGWGVGGDCKSARRGGKHAWGAWGILRHPIFSVLESTKRLVEDKPWKRAQGVGTEHPSATIKQRDWGCTQWAVGLLYNREITTLNVRAIKPNCFSSRLQHKALSLGLTDLPPPRWAAWYRSPVGASEFCVLCLEEGLSVSCLQCSNSILKEATDRTGSILGQTVDFELYAQYLWKQRTNWKTSAPFPWKSPRART